MVAIGRFDLLQSHGLDNFYDAQADAWLDGRWDIPRERLGFEAFIVDGKAYEYFGPFPALLRLPVAAFDSLDGRLTQLSLLAAFTVMMIATSRLLWRVRVLARGDAPVARTEAVTAGVFVFVVGAGSVVMFLGSRPIVYHETELWGAAWAVAALTAVLDFVIRPHRGAVVAAGVLTTLAILTRGSVGIAPVIAFGLVFLALVLDAVRWPNARRWFAIADGPRFLLPVFAAIAVPVVLYCSVNFIKFDHPWQIPIDDQIATIIDPVKPGIFETTDGSLFAPKFFPTAALAAFRPDAIAFDGLFPFVTFPDRADVLGGITFASVDPAASMPASMPLLFLVGVVGAFAIWWPRRENRPAFAPLRTLTVGGLAAGFGVISIPYVNQRYWSDFMPLLIVLAAAGTYVVLQRAATWRRPAVRAVAIAAGVLVIVSVWFNVGLALQYQRAYSPFADDSERATFVRFQHDLDEKLPGGSRLRVHRGAELPADAARAGTVFVVGDCDAVYWSDGVSWYPIERTAASGLYPLRLTFPDRPAGTRETLLLAGPPEEPDQLEVEYLGDGAMRILLTSPKLDQVVEGEPFTVTPGQPVDVDIIYDTRAGGVGVTVDGGLVFELAYLLAHDPIEVMGDLRPTPASFCEALRQA